MNERKRGGIEVWDEGKLKYDSEKKYDRAFGEIYSERKGVTEVFSYHNMSLDSRLNDLAKLIIKESLQKDASDIKIYRYDATNAFVELRIAGRMEKVRRIDVRAVNGLVQVFKRMAGMDVSETKSKSTGDGRISLEVGGIPYNLRVNSIPSVHNETLSIRIIKSDDTFNNLEFLGFPEFVLNRFRKVLSQSEGMVVLSGATGSGKSVRKNTEIPTPDGMRVLEDIKVGDKVLDKNGQPSEVVGVYPQGKQKTYKLTFSDNSTVFASYDHLWEVELKEDNGQYISKILETEQLIKLIEKKDIYISNIYQPVEFNQSYNIKSEIKYRDKGKKDIHDYIEEGKEIDFDFNSVKDLTIYERKAYIEGVLSVFLQENETYIFRHIDEQHKFIDGIRSIISSLGYNFNYNTVDKMYDFRFSNELQYKGRYITSIVETDAEESICLEVDNQDSQFLITSSFIPTHNTTTMYTALKEIIRLTKGVKNIHTIEDPVESLIAGTVQNEVNEIDGFTFAQGIRGLLRQNPDIILIGEIRDSISAQTALRAATSGHLLFTTIHTNNALTVPMVMQQYELKKNEIASALQMVLNQRLVPKLCDSCKITGSITTKDQNYLAEIGLDYDGLLRVAKRDRDGCENCDYTGYNGKVMIVEMLDADRNFDEVLNISNNDYELKKNLEASERKSYYSKEEDVQRHLKNMVIDFKTAEDVIR